MNKNRLEALSDGVFAIVMTLLVIEILVPDLHFANDRELWEALSHRGSLFVSYFVSFSVLSMFWIAHNFFYGAFTKNVNRVLVLLNILYLSFVALIPFSAHLLGEYSASRLAIFLYGLNVFIIGILAWVVLRYALSSQEIDTAHLSRRLLIQAQIRSALTPACTFLGMLMVWVNIPLALFLYTFPIVFNIIPGLLDRLERRLKLNFD